MTSTDDFDKDAPDIDDVMIRALHKSANKIDHVTDDLYQALEDARRAAGVLSNAEVKAIQSDNDRLRAALKAMRHCKMLSDCCDIADKALKEQ